MPAECRVLCTGWGRRTLEASVGILDGDAAAAWDALQSCVSLVGVRMPWIERWEVDDAGQIDATVVVSRVLGLRADLHLEVDARADERVIHVRATRAPSWLTFRCDFAADAREVRLSVELEFLPMLPSTVLDAKLRRAGEQFVAALEACLRTRVAVCDAVHDEVVLRHDDDHRSLLSRTFRVQCGVDTVWRTLRLFPLLVTQLAFVTSAHTREVSDDESVLELEVCLSQTLRLTVRCQLQVTFDDAERTMRVCTLASTWGTYDATFRLRADGSAGCAVSYASAFAGTTLAGFHVPFLDAKLRDFTARLVRAVQSSVVKASWREAFVGTFDELVVAPLVHGADFGSAMQFADVREHTARMLKYTAQGGKAYRALLVRLAAEGVRGEAFDAAHDAAALRRVHVLGHVTELLQAFALIADDIMDKSETRRGKPCWYRVVGTPCAINDSLLTFGLMNRLLAAHFEGALFEKLARLVFDTSVQTCFGQMLDTFSEGAQLEMATRARYDAIVLLKTTYYTIYDPLAKGVLLCELPEAEERALLANVHEVSVHIGQLFQEQDDYLDCYGDPQVTGKVGTDVVDGKCTWILTWALARADDAQRAELARLYGSVNDVTRGEQVFADLGVADDVARVKQLFADLGVHAEYRRRQAAAADACVAQTDPRLRSTVVAILAELLNRKM